MKLNKLFISVLTVLVVTWIVAFMYEPKLPEQIPTHWNIKGEVDDYTSKPWGVYMLPLISTATNLLLFFLPKIAPKGFKLDAAKKVYEILILVMAVFLLAVMVLMFEAALNNDIDMNQWIMGGVGLLFVIIGNYLSKVPKNFFLGIRTPWTLASDEVWFKTHKLGAWAFVVCGLLVMIGALLAWPVMLLTGLLMAAGFVPLIYSLIIYKKIEGFSD